MATATLHHTVVRPETGVPDRAALFLHGILGTGANLRPLAQHWIASDPRYVAVLVDLRKHGRSQHLAPPHTLAACAADLCALERHLPVPVHAVVGHSFGGKVALAYARERPTLERLVSLDSGPGARPDRHGSEQTLSVIAMLERLPPRFARRDEFLARVHAEGHSRMIADWLAMNLERDGDGFRLRLELPAIRALIDDYFAQDLWDVLEQAHGRVDVVIGGRSQVWDHDDVRRLEAIEARSGGRVRMHLLPNAGHWVHVDDPEGVKRALG